MSASSLSHRLPTTEELQLKKHSLKPDPRKVLSEAAVSGQKTQRMTPAQLAAVLFDQACMRAGVKNLWIATTLKVSEPTVSKWRSPDYAEGPSWVQLVALGPDFNRALKKEQAKFHGWYRQALIDLVEIAGEMDEAVGE